MSANVYIYNALRKHTGPIEQQTKLFTKQSGNHNQQMTKYLYQNDVYNVCQTVPL
jgi:hypothetical protein